MTLAVCGWAGHASTYRLRVAYDAFVVCRDRHIGGRRIETSCCPLIGLLDDDAGIVPMRTDERARTAGPALHGLGPGATGVCPAIGATACSSQPDLTESPLDSAGAGNSRAARRRRVRSSVRATGAVESHPYALLVPRALRGRTRAAREAGVVLINCGLAQSRGLWSGSEEACRFSLRGGGTLERW